jgi:uncharacterized protein
MPERDGYIPGVPCWVDASEPDPQAAVDFYGALLAWEFRDVMPASADVSYFIAWRKTRGWSLFDMSGEPRSGNVAAITSMPKGAVPRAMWNTYISVASADEPRPRSTTQAVVSWWSPSTSPTPAGRLSSPTRSRPNGE